jgi:hypothetical protein
MDFFDDHPGCAVAVLVFVVVFVLAIMFNAPIRGAFVKSDVALQAAQAQLGANVELGSKHVWFVHWRGCDKGDVAMFKVQPYSDAQGKIVDNAIVCAGWPFKGTTVRFK